MAYDEDLANRLRQQLRTEPGLSEKRMFGGLGFLIDGHLAVSAASKGGLLLRVDPAQADELIADPLAERFVMRGREMNGWLHVRLDATAGERDLAAWVRRGITYVRSLPPKT